MEDELYLAAKTFEKLTKIKYEIILGFKGKNVNLDISFDNSHFKHLCGLHKLTDIAVSSYDANILFRDILNKKVTLNDIIKSEFFENISNRLFDLKNIDKYFDNSKNFYGWSISSAVKNKINSRINADYLIKDKSIYIENSNSFIFLAVDSIDKITKKAHLIPTEIINNAVAISFFSSKTDYSNLQKKFTLLLKKKIDIPTSKSEILYQLPSYKPINGENPLPIPQIADLNDEAAATKEERDSNLSTPQIVTLDDDFTTTDQTNISQSGKLKLSDVLNRCNEVMNKQQTNTSNKGKDISVQKNNPVK